MGMSPTDPIVRAALATQEEERATGFASANSSLDVIQNDIEPSELPGLIRALSLGHLSERELGARLLAHAGLPSMTVTAEVQRLLRDETHPDVIRWLVAALQHARDPSALGLLKTLAGHPDARVRFGVPDALSSSTRNFGDVADEMIELSRDVDRDVRWSATFEMAAWLTGDASASLGKDSDRVITRLRELASSDLDAEIRSAAARASEIEWG